MVLLAGSVSAQELQVKININSQQVEGTDKSVFENLQQTLQQWMDDRQWTELQFQKNERIVCNFNITVTKYDKPNNRFMCTALIQANRPVYNSAYTTTLYNNKDADFNFDFMQFDQLNFNDEVIDNQLTALMAYYAYLIIGLDLDSFSPLGGTDVLQRCMQLTNNAQDLGFTGWKAFETSRNRFAIINDYLDEAMKPFRQLQYDYYRTGLDEMAQNAERGRTNVTTALEQLKKAHEELATKEFVVKKAGIIEVTIMGDKKVKSIKIDKDALSADNEEMVEETLAMAINEAYDKVQAEADAIEERVTGQRGVLGF